MINHAYYSYSNAHALKLYIYIFNIYCTLFCKLQQKKMSVRFI
jgi:hypothetical protein